MCLSVSSFCLRVITQWRRLGWDYPRLDGFSFHLGDVSGKCNADKWVVRMHNGRATRGVKNGIFSIAPRITRQLYVRPECDKRMSVVSSEMNSLAYGMHLGIMHITRAKMVALPIVYNGFWRFYNSVWYFGTWEGKTAISLKLPSLRCNDVWRK